MTLVEVALFVATLSTALLTFAHVQTALATQRTHLDDRLDLEARHRVELRNFEAAALERLVDQRLATGLLQLDGGSWNVEDETWFI